MRRRRWLLPVFLLVGLPGCTSDAGPRLVDYLKELEFDGPMEKADYVSLGKFDVPVPATAANGGDQGEPASWIRLRVSVSVETPPENAAVVKRVAKQSRAEIRDAILSSLRLSNAEELSDPRFAALKGRIAEAVRPLLGENSFRQLVFPAFDTEAM